jgi:hypothetical protein
MNISTKTDGVDVYFNIEDFKDVINIKKVAFYSLAPNPKEGVFTIKFYDKKKKLVKPYGK